MKLIVYTLLTIASIFTLGIPTAFAVSESQNIDSQTIIQLTNAERTQKNLPALKESSVLDEAARLKAEDMVRNGYFAHNSPEGKNPWYWFKIAGYNFSSAGENLAVLYNDSDRVVVAWMNSSSHRANILSNSFTEIGMAVLTGTYNGVETSYVVEEFGKKSISRTNKKSSKILVYKK